MKHDTATIAEVDDEEDEIQSPATRVVAKLAIDIVAHTTLTTVTGIVGIHIGAI